jgi:hypothetical protein
MRPACFPILILNARPAAGKSEIIHYLRTVPEAERTERFHIGPLKVFDDFPMLWAWFEEDDLLERVFQRPRLHTTPEGYFIHDDLWHLLVRRLCLNYQKWRRDAPDPKQTTAVIEFSRGESHGGYRAAYGHLSDAILEQASSLYIKVSYQESLRKNQARSDPERADTILQHSLPKEKMERLYRRDDWDRFCAPEPSYLHVRGRSIPYAIFDNEDDLTTRPESGLDQHLQETLNRLWNLYEKRP